MNKLIIFVFSIFIISCGGEELKQDVISLDDLIGETGEIEVDSLIVDLDSSSTLNFELASFVKSQINDYDTLGHNEFHWIDRFSISSSKKIKFIGKNDVKYGRTNTVTPIANLFYYTFKDTVSNKNAFYNWLDCFGSDCDVLSLNEDVESIKTPPMFTLVYDTTILVVEYLCEHVENDWDSFQDSLLMKFGENYRYAIEVGCGGPLKWK